VAPKIGKKKKSFVKKGIKKKIETEKGRIPPIIKGVSPPCGKRIGETPIKQIGRGTFRKLN